VSFESFSEFLAMGRHGLFVWSAYACALAVLVINVAMPLVARRRHLQQEARRLRRETVK
jgi:heme exporter protein D